MAKSKMRIGYIARYGGCDSPKFTYREDSYTRRITSRGDRVYCTMLYPTDYEEVQNTTEIMKENGLIVVCEPFFVDDELREKATKWVEWANNADPKDIMWDTDEEGENETM